MEKEKGKQKQNKQKELTGSPRNLVNVNGQYLVLLVVTDLFDAITPAHAGVIAHTWRVSALPIPAFHHCEL